MSEAAIFSVELDRDLRDEFIAEAEANDRPASEVVRDFMRQFIDEQRRRREHTEFVQAKVERARQSIREDNGIPNDVVSAEFAARRARITGAA